MPTTIGAGTMPIEFSTIYDSADKIPATVEDFPSLFTEKNGKFELTGIAGVQTPANISRLETSLSNERGLHKETKEKLKIWGDLDFADVSAKLDRFPELEAASKGNLDDAAIEEAVQRRVEGTINTKLAPLQRELKATTTERDALLAENNGFKQGNTQRKIHDSMRVAMKGMKVLGEAEEDVLLRDGLFEINEEGNVLTRDGVGVAPGLSPESWLTEMQETKTHWWPGSQGGGAGGSKNRGGFTGKNPWSGDSWNMTEQGAYLRTHGKERAEKMAQAAGTTLGGTKPVKRPA